MILENMKSINKNDDMTLHAQIKVAVRDFILQHLKPGDQIPTEKEISEHYNVSRITVRKAIETLMSEGLLYRERGKGTFVSPNKVAQKLNELKSFDELIVEQGKTPFTKTISYEEIQANEMLKSKLQVHDDDLVHKARRIRFVNDEPIVYQVVYIPKKVCPVLKEDDLKRSVINVMEEKYDIPISKSVDTIECVKADANRAQALNVRESDTLMLIQRLVFSKNEVPLIFLRSFYRNDNFKASVILHR